MIVPGGRAAANDQSLVASLIAHRRFHGKAMHQSTRQTYDVGPRLRHHSVFRVVN
jgi:predicted Zn-dependent protease